MANWAQVQCGSSKLTELGSYKKLGIGAPSHGVIRQTYFFGGEVAGLSFFVVGGKLINGSPGSYELVNTVRDVVDFAPGRTGFYADSVVVDAQGLVRHGRVGPLVSDGDVDRDLLGHITALKLNDEEAELLCGGTDEGSLRSLGIPEIVLTLGSEGATIISGEITTHVDAVPVEGPVDPTGAGDSFLLSYAAARERGVDPHEAGRIASRFVSTIIAR
jgi:hypothetical protein